MKSTLSALALTSLFAAGCGTTSSCPDGRSPGADGRCYPQTDGGDVSDSSTMQSDACMPGPDRPDPMGIDSNCDGIDGDLANAVFVAPGTGTGAGTRDNPFHSISEAIAAAAPMRKQVLVAAGMYSEQITLSDGVLIAGGYDAATWRRTFARTAVSAPCPVVTARNITSETPVMNIDFVGNDVTTAGGSCIAALVVDSSGPVFSDLTIHAGHGGPGTNGRDGAPPSMPVAEGGGRGQAGREDSSDIMTRARGGAAGMMGCAPGGEGGGGGITSSRQGLPGVSGLPSSSENQGGATTSANYPGNPGGNGAAGSAGTPGTSSTIIIGTFDRMGNYDASQARGTDGMRGTDGHGGGGGSGAGYYYACSDGITRFVGGGGGGGGAGGCGGNPGEGGGGGGASVAVLLWNSTPTFERVTFETAGGGDGGSGGAGGVGQRGGPGGTADQCERVVSIMPPRFEPCTCPSSTRPVPITGGNGGSGGDGGNGGAGGGGAGGPSIGIVTNSDTPPQFRGSSTWRIGPGGNGGRHGSSTGTPGATGLRNEMHRLR